MSAFEESFKFTNWPKQEAFRDPGGHWSSLANSTEAVKALRCDLCESAVPGQFSIHRHSGNCAHNWIARGKARKRLGTITPGLASHFTTAIPHAYYIVGGSSDGTDRHEWITEYWIWRQCLHYDRLQQIAAEIEDVTLFGLIWICEKPERVDAARALAALDKDPLELWRRGGTK